MPRLRAGRLSPQFRDVITHDVEKGGAVLFVEGCSVFRGAGNRFKRPGGGGGRERGGEGASRIRLMSESCHRRRFISLLLAAIVTNLVQYRLCRPRWIR